jgi:hypoxanthine phosphoribosyltransferase
MLTEDGKNLYVSYDEYHKLIEKLAIKVHLSGWEFDTILCLARGGMRPGDILSRIFGKPLAIMSTSSYHADAGTVQGQLDIARFITTPKGEIAGRVLLVDDLADTGQTLKSVVDQLKTNFKPITELLNEAQIQVKEASGGLRRQMEKMESDGLRTPAALVPPSGLKPNSQTALRAVGPSSPPPLLPQPKPWGRRGAKRL